jgi:hypothetical protein
MRDYGPRLLGRQRRRYKPEVAPTGLGSQPAFCASRVGQDVPRLGKYGYYAVTVTILYPLLVSFSIMRAPRDRKTHIPKALGAGELHASAQCSQRATQLDLPVIYD